MLLQMVRHGGDTLTAFIISVSNIEDKFLTGSISVSKICNLLGYRILKYEKKLKA